MKKIVTLLALILGASFFVIISSWAVSDSGSIIGKWKTIDDNTNEPKSIVEIYEKQGKYFGKVVELFSKPDEDPNRVCDKCSDDDPRKDKPIKGMEIIQELVKDGDEFGGGTITDPDNGKIYDCKLWVEDGNLQVRGYIAFFFRTQTWLRVE